MNYLVKSFALRLLAFADKQLVFYGSRRHVTLLLAQPNLHDIINLQTASKRLLSSNTDFKPSEELAKERYDVRASEDIEKKRARLMYQSKKRGMLENGVILASFAEKHLNTLSADLLDQYDRLINLPTNDWDIYYWATKTKPTPKEFETPVLNMLRDHLSSKVSNEDIGIKCKTDVLGKSKLDEIVMPAIKRKYELDIDVSKVDLTNYKEDIFDKRIKKFHSNKSIEQMTEWRKRLFERRLRRTLSSPTSLKTLSEENQSKKDVYTQKVNDKEVMNETVEPKDLIESNFEKAMKHHDLLQYLLGAKLTKDALEYDDEAEAWANLLWHRNYGTEDNKIAPSKTYRCSKCISPLQCCDTGLNGYVPKEIFISLGANKNLESENILCQICKFSETYNTELSCEMQPNEYIKFLRGLSQEKSALVIVLVDLMNFPGSIWEGLIDFVQGNKQFIVVGNKLDLLPYDGPKLVERVNYAFRKNLERLRPGKSNLRIGDSHVLSARTGFGIDGLVSRILERLENKSQKVYLIGSKNSGKSTLFNSLLQSDLCAVRTNDLISRVSSYRVPGHNLSMLKFPINIADGWEVEMKKRKTERRERNSALQIHSLATLSERRQESMPHIATLINRLDYDQPSNQTALTHHKHSNIETTISPRFSDDHPLSNVKNEEVMSATEDKFQHNPYFHLSPSSCHSDQLSDILTYYEKLEVFPNLTIVPRKYSIRPLQTIFIAGLARLDLLTSQSNVMITVFASKYLPVHVVQTSKADKFYNTFLGTPYLGVPFGDKTRMVAWPEMLKSASDYHISGISSQKGSADVVFSSFGWTLINVGRDQECILRAHTPGGRGMFLRDPPLLSKANIWSSGKKIRDTPVFLHPHFSTETTRL